MAAAPCPDLDLAFAVEADLPRPCSSAAAELADPLLGAERWGEHLSQWLGQLAEELPPPLRAPAYSLGLRLCDDASIQELNRDWRGLDRPTDVLAFAALESAEGEELPFLPLPEEGEEGEALELGDVVISLDTAARQAEEHGHGLERELLFLASHGLLHLLGWDHPDEASLAVMLRRQERLLGDGAA
jgi:probable rRNA maturation factor